MELIEDMKRTIYGKVFSGEGNGRKFVELPWVRRQIEEKLGFKPFPGTLNLRLDEADKNVSIFDKCRSILIRPEKGYFAGRAYKILITDKVPGAVIRPNIVGYPEDVLEIVSPISLRNRFNLEDGDLVEVTFDKWDKAPNVTNHS